MVIYNEEMNIKYEFFSNLTDDQIKYIAEIDSKIPNDLDPHYHWTPECADERYEYFKKLEGLKIAALNENQVIGFHVLYLVIKPFASIANISTFWIHQNFRKQGIGQHLKKLGEDWASEHDCTYLQTNVHRANTRMVEINEKNGFEFTYLNMRKYLK